LRLLGLSNNRISDLAPLAAMTSLTELTFFQDQKIPGLDLSPLSALSSLTHPMIELGGNKKPFDSAPLLTLKFKRDVSLRIDTGGGICLNIDTVVGMIGLG
jgi:hypothetical protein